MQGPVSLFMPLQATSSLPLEAGHPRGQTEATPHRSLPLLVFLPHPLVLHDKKTCQTCVSRPSASDWREQEAGSRIPTEGGVRGS